MTAIDGRVATGQASEERIGFLPPGLHVDVEELDASAWKLLQAFEYQAQTERYTVPANQRTDFASVPRAFVWFIPTYGRYTKAAILHDHLCDLARAGTFDRRDADGIFRQAMRSLGVAFLRRWIMWAAVRWGALGTAAGRKGWIRDAPKVVLISIPTVVLLAPAAILVLITLLVWYVVEGIAWVPLEVTARAKRKRRQPTKRVNPPTLSLKT
jgi:Protein of unknown function (DUF1353)